MSDSLAKEVNIGALFNEFSFRIPIYQRNYAWGEEEITQLLQDINDIGDKQNYYLGTLVLYKNDSHLDVIDGQQRLTTLYLLRKILSIRIEGVPTSNKDLNFESRPKTIAFFKTLSEKKTKDALEKLCEEAKDLDNFVVAINAINKFFDQDLKEKEIEPFKNKCLNKTYLFTTVLPATTDVNHYFEIMNNRGEQLEKHEILKVNFLNVLKPEYSKEKFAAIWEACSQMDNHVQYYIRSTDDRKALFGDNYNTFPGDDKIETFLKISQDNNEVSSSEESNQEEHVGFNILKNHILKNDFNQEDKNQPNEKFKSIIDFENFLLQVLSLMKDYENTNLEDKNLLKNFGYDIGSDIVFPDPIEFIKKLLQVRFLFDKYVVKREFDDEEVNGWKWTIREFKYDEKTSFVQNYTFGTDNYSKKLTQLQTMFQVSYSPNVNKKWLRELLLRLSYNTEAQYIYDFLMELMQERYKDSGFDTNQGLQTPRAVFNFLDYLLWEEYYNQVRGKDNIKDLDIETSEKDYLKKIFDLKDNFNKFYFTQRNSIEHFFPQSKENGLVLIDNHETKEENGIKYNVINSFGNLCLISSSSNSSYNKEHPSFKKSKGRSKNESLKQQIMFESMNGDSWGQKEIENHQEEMLELLNSKLETIQINKEQ